MSGREVGMRGVVRPDLDSRALDQTVRRLEDEMNRAAQLAPSLNLDGVKRQLERILPGGGGLGAGINRVKDKLSSSGQQAAGEGGLKKIQLAQLDKLGDIEEVLEKRGVSEAKSGGGGGGMLNGLGLMSLLSGGGVSLGAAGTVGGIGGAVTAITALEESIGALPDQITKGPLATAMGSGNIKTRAMSLGLGVGKELSLKLAEDLGIKEEFDAGVKDLEQTLGRIGETALSLPSKTQELLSNLELSVPEIPDLELPDSIPQLDPPAATDLPQLQFDAPKWLERYAKAVFGGGGNSSPAPRTESNTTGGSVDFSGNNKNTSAVRRNPRSDDGRVDVGGITINVGRENEQQFNEIKRQILRELERKIA